MRVIAPAGASMNAPAMGAFSFTYRGVIPTMAETETVETATADEAVEENETAEQTEEQEEAPDGALKALRAERQARKAAEKRAREAEARAENANLEPDEQKLADAKREAAADAVRSLGQKYVRAEAKAALAGKVTDPVRVMRLIDLSSIELDDDGEFEAEAITDAIDAFLDDFPEFKASSSPGSADQFSQGRKAQKPAKPTANELIRAAFQKD